jgi:uncharacterized protein
VIASNWQVVKAHYWDIKLNKLKTLHVSDIRKVDGIWTRHHMQVENHKTGHSTEFEFSGVNYQTPLKDSLFTRRTLSRGGGR